MFASTSYSFLPPTTPPPPFSVYNSYGHFEDDHSVDAPYYASSQFGDDQDSLDDQDFPPYCAPSLPSAALAAYDPPSKSFASPLPVMIPSAPGYDVRSALDITSPVDVTGSLSEFHTRCKMDMGMAVEGTVASQAGIQTPLGQYAAQMVVWLWHGTHAQPPTPVSASSSPLINSPNPFEPSQHSAPLNPLQVSPSPEFSAFVERLLRITMVSHSVTLIALLYIYRLKMRNNIQGDPGSEQRPFVVSLILGNKYLDDNTYTNKTWADLAGLKLEELNRMEAEFLKGLDFSLGVDRSDYQHWRNLLDGFVFARQREAVQAAHNAARHHRPSYGQLYPPLSYATPQVVTDSSYIRARSASPTQMLSPTFASNAQSYGYPSPAHKKRTALDAFSMDTPGSSTVYEQMRLPARKAHFGSIDLTSSKSRQPSPSGLARSSSLNRRIARLPGDNGRRGSMGNVHGLPTPDTGDLRHAAALHWQQEHDAHSQQWDTCSALSAAYQRPAQAIVVPPEHMMFYQLAAEAHPGYDGAPRKAILHYQQRPTAPQHIYPPPMITPAPVVFNPAYLAEDRIPHADYPMPAQSYGFAAPQPAQFANAGPPGYAYDPLHRHSQPTPSYHNLDNAGYNGPAQWAEESRDPQQTAMIQLPIDPRIREHRARSQWSSPMQAYANPHVWQRQ